MTKFCFIKFCIYLHKFIIVAPCKCPQWDTQPHAKDNMLSWCLQWRFCSRATHKYLTNVHSHRNQDGSEVLAEENHKAEELSKGIQHFALPFTMSLHHQHVWNCLWDRRVLHLRPRICASWRSLWHHSPSGEPTDTLKSCPFTLCLQ